MLFRSKVDKYFMILISLAFLAISAVLPLPLFLDEKRTVPDTVIVLILYLLTAGLLLWIAIDIKYVFYADFLLVKAGLVRRRIPYAEISKVTATNEIMTGFRLLSSKDALGITYQKREGSGSVKISPKDKVGFIGQLQKHGSHIIIDIPY